MSRSTAGQMARKRSVSPPSPTLSWEISHRVIEEEVDDGSMHDPRTSTALRQLAHLDEPPPPTRWRWTVARLDTAGRLPLPRHARTALGLPAGVRRDVRARLHRAGLVLTAGDGPGGSLPVDGRGRLAVPAALRSTVCLVIGTQAELDLVVVAPATVLDGLGDILAGRPA